VPAAHVCPLSFLHAPLPLHELVPLQAPSSCPAGTFEQVPTEPGSTQLWHVPEHALLQQTPSTEQMPLAHVPPIEQVWPFAALLQLLPPDVPSHALAPEQFGGSWTPAGTMVHWPRDPGTLHDRQSCVQTVSQQ